MDCVRVQDTELNDPMWVSSEKNFLNLWGQMGSFFQELYLLCCPRAIFPLLVEELWPLPLTREVPSRFACCVPPTEAGWEHGSAK